MIGIYAIVNKLNNKVYVGQSINIRSRLTKHKWELNKNIHHNPHLQYAWNKYGEDCFDFITLCETTEEKLDEMEQYYIFAFDACDEEFLYVSVLHLPTGRVEYTIQELYYGDAQALLEDDIIFIEDNLLDVFDKDRTFGEIVVIDDNDDIEEEIVEAKPIKPVTTFYDIVDGVVEHILDVVSKEKCPKCLRTKLEEILINAYEYGIE